MRGIYSQLWELAHPYLQTRHNEEHTKGSYEFAKILVKEEKGDDDIVFPAIILHDVGWSRVPEELHLTAFGPGKLNEELRRVHEIEGAKIACEILFKVGYQGSKIKEILSIIEGHDSRLQPLSLNDQLVKDSDKLFRFSPRGFAIDCERFKIKPYRWYKHLSDVVEEWLFTTKAKELALEQLQRFN